MKIIKRLSRLSAIFTFSLITTACVEGGLFNFFEDVSRVYYTNNTDTAVTISPSEQTTGNRLTPGVHWSNANTTVPPYETREIFSVNRSGPIVNNEVYTFNTKVTTAANDVITLQKKVVGDRFIYGFYDHANLPPLHDDTKLHSFATTKVNQPANTEVAYRGKSKGRVNDVYYAITDEYMTPTPSADANKLSVLTYNIWGGPFIADLIIERFNALPAYLKGYDVIMLQEAFSPERRYLFAKLAAEYPHQATVLNDPGLNLYDGGVTILSRHPIVKESQAIFPDCLGSECLAEKGIKYVEIIKGGQSYHLLAAHMTSNDSRKAREFRQRQFIQMRGIATAQAIPATDVVIYGGDFNVNRRIFPSDHAQMLANLQAATPADALTGNRDATFDPRINVFAAKTGPKIEYLDYVVVSNEYKAVTSTNKVRVPRETNNDLFQIWDLSDHFPVEANIE